MTSDRLGRDSFRLTHESLAGLLGVRRASISEAAETLQRAGLVEYRAGWMTIVDRHGLETAACEDYRLVRDAYARMYRR
jgi:Mn-dependent DtxR family transcriptional regulator